MVAIVVVDVCAAFVGTFGQLCLRRIKCLVAGFSFLVQPVLGAAGCLSPQEGFRRSKRFTPKRKGGVCRPTCLSRPATRRVGLGALQEQLSFRTRQRANGPPVVVNSPKPALLHHTYRSSAHEIRVSGMRTYRTSTIGCSFSARETTAGLPRAATTRAPLKYKGCQANAHPRLYRDCACYPNVFATDQCAIVMPFNGTEERQMTDGSKRWGDLI
jgi:hypothetical protein